MKKMFVIILSLTLALTFAACGDQNEYYEESEKDSSPRTAQTEENRNQSTLPEAEETLQATEPVLDREPNEDEKAAIDRYYEIAYNLERYMEEGTFQLRLDEAGFGNMDVEAAAFCYEELPKLAQVEQFADSQYCAEKNYDMPYTVSWNAQDYLQHFVTYENILLSVNTQRTDYVGNVKEGGGLAYLLVDGVLYEDYKRQNTLEKIDNKYLLVDDYLPTEYYNEDGTLAKVEYRNKDYIKYGIKAVRVPQYENGLRVKDIITTDSGYTCEVNYSYDDQGRRTQIKFGQVQWDFSYDENGNQVKQVRTGFSNDDVANEKIYEYTYNDQGSLVSGSLTVNEYIGYAGRRELSTQQIDTYTYTCDDQGNILGYTVDYGDTMNMYRQNAGKVYSKADYTTGTATYTYGDVVIFQK